MASANPAKPDDPKSREAALGIASNIKGYNVRKTAATSSAPGEASAIITPAQPARAEFYSELESGKAATIAPAGVDQITYTVSDHEKYMEYKKNKMAQLEGETLKQEVREMYDKYKAQRNYAEMDFLEKEFPWIKEEKQQFADLNKWALDMLSEYHSTGGKPTQKMLEFMYAVKTDENLKKIVNNLNSAFKPDTDSWFGKTAWEAGWATRFFYPKVAGPTATLWEAGKAEQLAQATGVTTETYLNTAVPSSSKYADFGSTGAYWKL
jgi:hypothetical protein